MSRKLRIHHLLFIIRKSKGFTFVELLIVVVTIGVLGVVAFNLINPVARFQKAQDSIRKSDLAQIQKAVERFHQDFGMYPVSTKDYKIKASDSENSIEWGLSWLPYMENLPKDPSSSSKNYVYYSTGNGQTYYLYASLDRGTNDPQICNRGNACQSLPAGASCGLKVVCDYGVSSPNVSP